MNPPLPRPEPAKLYRGTRSGSLQDLILRGCSPGLSSPFQARPDLLPSHIPSETVLVGRTPGLPRGPLFIFRKNNLYGKTKKSTHDHTTQTPTLPGPCFRRLERPQSAREPTAGPYDRPRGLQRPRRSPSRVGRLPYTYPTPLPPKKRRPPAFQPPPPVFFDCFSGKRLFMFVCSRVAGLPYTHPPG